jgi:hypothetical protein
VGGGAAELDLTEKEEKEAKRHVVRMVLGGGMANMVSINESVQT